MMNESTIQELHRRTKALMSMFDELYGRDVLLKRAKELGVDSYLESEDHRKHVWAIRALLMGQEAHQPEDVLPQHIDEIENLIADRFAKRAVEEQIEAMVAEKLDEKHQEYVRQVRAELLVPQKKTESAATLKKYAQLEKMETQSLRISTLDTIRPRHFSDIVGQEQGIRSLMAKLATPFPQHVIIYGPPGVGKTTAARIALEEAAKSGRSAFAKGAPFIEVDGTTLRWDPRDMTNPLLGSVHDPLYQGARKDLAETAVPEPKLGLVTQAQGGVLFIDEIGELDPILQNKLLKVLEDKRVHFESPYYDPDDANVPKYIKKLFDEGAPADFILIGATTRDPSEINPALRSRCAEVFFEPLTPDQVEQVVQGAADRLGVGLEREVPSEISRYTIQGRKAVHILMDAYGQALHDRPDADETRCVITVQDVEEVARLGRLRPYARLRLQQEAIAGQVNGLGVAGFVGSVLEIETVAFRASVEGRGVIRFNDTAGSMAKDSVFNAAAVFRKVMGQDLSDYDVHINVVGGGRVDGPSAGVAIFLALYSAITGQTVPANVGITGEISIHGQVKPVGGVAEKIFGARQAGLTHVIIPAANAPDVPRDTAGMQVTCVESIEQVMDVLWGGSVCQKNLSNESHRNT